MDKMILGKNGKYNTRYYMIVDTCTSCDTNKDFIFNIVQKSTLKVVDTLADGVGLVECNTYNFIKD